MRIGIPKETKNNENRVAMTPAGVVSLTHYNHEVYIETGAGLGSSFTDQDYIGCWGNNRSNGKRSMESRDGNESKRTNT